MKDAHTIIHLSVRRKTQVESGQNFAHFPFRLALEISTAASCFLALASDIGFLLRAFPVDLEKTL